MGRRGFERDIDLVCICDIELRGRKCAAYLLRSGRKYVIVFGFVIQGIHTLLKDEQIATNLESLREGAKGFPADERLSIHFRSVSSDRERLNDLELKAEATSIPALALLNYGEQRKVSRLTSEGLRQQKDIYLFAYYTINSGKSANQDQIEQAVAWLIDEYQAIKGRRGKARTKVLWAEMLTQAFNEGFLYWEQQIATRMGLVPTAMSAKGMWAYAYGEFNSSDAPDIPHLLVCREVDGKPVVEEFINSNLSPASVLVRGENGLPSVPRSGHHYAKVKGKVVGALVLDDRLEGFANKEHELFFLWRLVSEIPNCEVVSELYPADHSSTTMKLRHTTKQQVGLAKRADERGSADPLAQMLSKSGVEAQKALIQGHRSMFVSVVIFLYCDTPRQLTDACQKLVTAFPQGKLIRETDVAWKLWLHKHPFVSQHLLSDLGRRQVYLTTQVPGLMPVARTRSLDDRGLELIARQGRTPFYVNFTTQHRGIMIFGKSRRGKTTLAADIIKTGLDDNLPVIVLDYGMADNRTSYSDLVDRFGEGVAANIDAANTYNNLLETPNLTRLNNKKRKEHQQVYQSFVVVALETLVMGDERGTRLAKRVRALLNYAIACFFEDPAIDARYRTAHLAGFGTAAWKAMPTLHDLLAFIRQIDLEELGGKETIGEALNETVMQLTTWLKSPVGRAISQPSAIRLTAQFLCFSLRGAKDDDEATVCALGAQSLALRRALEYPKSLLVVDEGAVLFRRSGLVYTVAETVVNGGKSGSSVCLISQDVDTVANSVAGPQFLANLDVRFIGAIEDGTVVDSYVRHLGISREALLPNTHQNFLPDPLRLCSHWLVSAEGFLTPVSHYPSEELLAAVANNPTEQAARARFTSQYQNQLEGWAKFAPVYADARRTGTPMSAIAPNVNAFFPFPEEAVPSDHNSQLPDPVQV